MSEFLANLKGYSPDSIVIGRELIDEVLEKNEGVFIIPELSKLLVTRLLQCTSNCVILDGYVGRTSQVRELQVLQEKIRSVRREKPIFFYLFVFLLSSLKKNIKNIGKATNLKSY
jgi:hypothetical protein